MNQREQITTNDEKNEVPSNYAPQSFPSSIKRKPIATTATDVPTTYPPAHTSTTTTVPPASQPSHQTRKPTLLSRFSSKYRSLSLPKRILLLLTPLLLLVLILGLSIGLSRHKHSNLPLPSSHGGPYTGDLTYYAPGLGACGVTSSSRDSIVSISHYVFDAVTVSANPNQNPLCGKKIRAVRNGKSRDLTVVDRCTGCEPRDLDVSISVFGDLADVDLGRVKVEWAWLEDVPEPASASVAVPASTSAA